VVTAAPTPLDPRVVRQIIHATLMRVLADAPRLFADLHDAVSSSAPQGLLDDPALAAEIERSNVAILAAWLQANLERPGEPVEPVLSPDTLDIVRDVARRGLEDSTYNYFRVGLAVASRHVMAAAFEQCSDPVLLRAALDAMLGSAAAYIDASVAALRTVVLEERAARATGHRGRRLEIVTELLEGATADTANASARLGFELGRPLLACILWTDTQDGPDSAVLEQVARDLAVACQVRSSLILPASAASVWAWLPTGRAIEVDVFRAIVMQTAGVRVAVGTPSQGVAGFRHSHLEAARTQRLMHRLGATSHVATYDEIRVAELAGRDEPAAAEFVSVVLGALAVAAPELRSTLRAVVASGFNSGSVAAELGVHRNTVLGRIRRAESLLPGGATRRWIDVALALELDRWLSSER
jgi:DNA-binding PucR family transcriptional regulator